MYFYDNNENRVSHYFVTLSILVKLPNVRYGIIKIIEMDIKFTLQPSYFLNLGDTDLLQVRICQFTH